MKQLLKAILWAIIAFFCPQYALSKTADNYTMEELLKALAEKESNNDPNAIGDNGEAVGMYQLHKIFVDDVNRISRPYSRPTNQIFYNYDDRLNPYKSKCMICIYLHHYAHNKSTEDEARIFNGGPKGYKKKSTLKYWQDIKAILEKNRVALGLLSLHFEMKKQK